MRAREVYRYISENLVNLSFKLGSFSTTSNTRIAERKIDGTDIPAHNNYTYMSAVTQSTVI